MLEPYAATSGTYGSEGDRRGNPPVLPGGRKALRTETTINDTTDFRIGKRLTNLPALREIGSTANRRLLRVNLGLAGLSV